jgi:hypothetical protein
LTTEPEPEPPGLDKVVAKHFERGKAILLRREHIDYRSELRPLWNGTVYLYKLSGGRWPRKVYVFEMPKSDASQSWQAHPDVPDRCQNALEAVKAAFRKSRSEQMGFEISG